MAENDIYNSEARYEKFKRDINLFVLPPEKIPEAVCMEALISTLTDTEGDVFLISTYFLVFL